MGLRPSEGDEKGVAEGAPAFMRGKERFSTPGRISGPMPRFSAGFLTWCSSFGFSTEPGTSPARLLFYLRAVLKI